MRRFAQNHRFYILFAFLLVMSSCVKEMDFGGVKEIKLEPEMEIKVAQTGISTEKLVSIIDEEIASKNLTPQQEKFIYTAQYSLPEQTAAVEITSEEQVVKYLKSATLDFRMINTTPRNIKIKVTLSKGEGTPIDSFEEYLPMLMSPTDTIVNSRIFEKGTRTENDLKNLNEIKVEITAEAGTDLRMNPTGKFELATIGFFNFSYDPSEGLP